MGSLLHYLAHASPQDFGPTNAMLGLLPELPEGSVDVRGLKRSGGLRAVRAAKGTLFRDRALSALESFLQNDVQER